MNKIASKAFMSNSGKLRGQKFYNCLKCGSLRMVECRDESEIYIYKRIQLLNNKEGCFRLGNPDLDFEIRKLISPPRNPSKGWISIKKSKSRFHGFPFCWEIRERICKAILMNSGLLFANYACANKTAVLKDSFSNPFSDWPIEQ